MAGNSIALQEIRDTTAVMKCLLTMASWGNGEAKRTALTEDGSVRPEGNFCKMITYNLSAGVLAKHSVSAHWTLQGFFHNFLTNKTTSLGRGLLGKR
jgi:hypothetical protein